MFKRYALLVIFHLALDFLYVPRHIMDGIKENAMASGDKMNSKIVTVFGGTGFVGTQVVRELAARGFRVKVATRVPERAYFLRPCGVVGQVVPFACDYSDDASIGSAVKGADFVVNCVGILFEKDKKGFARAHVDIPASIAKACKREKTARFVHLSALGIEASTSKYAATKLEGEAQIRKHFPQATFLRPSVIFGEGDDFFNMFAKMAKVLPVLPLIGGGETKFQPVYVGDVADSVLAALDDLETAGQVYELGGPEILNFQEVYERLFSYTKQKRVLLPLPFGVAKVQACFLSIMPKPLLTRDQVESLKSDSIVSDGALGLSDLGVNATGLDIILPMYLSRYRKGGRFADQKAA